MSFDSLSPLNALKTLVEGALSGETVYLGVPPGGVTRLFAYITLGGQDPKPFATNRLVRRVMRYRIVLAYSLEDAAASGGEEATAEQAMAGYVDAIVNALEGARDTRLSATVESLDIIDLTGADEPRYQMWSGLEHREYPIVVTVSQQRTYP